MGIGKLTTHVLDTASGSPAAGLGLALYRVEGDHVTLLKEAVTNDDGRVDGPILDGDNFKAGIYELRFQAGEYLRGSGVQLAEPMFLDEIPIRFGISDSASHYHVPLLLSPFGYSTYRGS